GESPGHGFPRLLDGGGEGPGLLLQPLVSLIKARRAGFLALEGLPPVPIRLPQAPVLGIEALERLDEPPLLAGEALLLLAQEPVRRLELLSEQGHFLGQPRVEALGAPPELGDLRLRLAQALGQGSQRRLLELER